MRQALIAALLVPCLGHHAQAADAKELPAAYLGLHSVLDRSDVDPSGAKDSFDGFVATSRFGGVTYVPPGIYRFSKTFSPPAEIPFFLAGAVIPSKNLSDIGDLMDHPTFTMLKTSNVPGTDDTLNVELNVQPGRRTGKYQKSALFVRATQNEGSPEAQCGRSGTRECKDVVGATITGNIGLGVVHGRAYAGNFTVDVPEGSTGSATAIEADVGNRTGIDTTDDFFTAAHQSGKFGPVVVCVGNAPCDAALYVTSQATHPNFPSGQPQWLDGLRIVSSSLKATGGFAFRLLNDLGGDLRNVVSSIDRLGNARFASMVLAEPLPIKSGGTGDAGTAYLDYKPALNAEGQLGTRPPVATGRYKVLGKTVFVEIAISFGSDFSRGHPTATSYRVSLPREPLGPVVLGGKAIKGDRRHVDLTSDEFRSDLEVSYFDGTIASGDDVRIVAGGSYEMR